MDKAADSLVFAGTVNGEGLLRVEVSKLAKESWQKRICLQAAYFTDVQVTFAEISIPLLLPRSRRRRPRPKAAKSHP